MSKTIFTKIQETRSAIMQMPEMTAHVDRWGFSFIRAKVLVDDGHDKYLVVEEKRARVNGEFRDVRDIWNFPGGSLNSPSEDLFDAACREVFEETGYPIQLIGFLGVQQTKLRNDPCVTFMFLGKLAGSNNGLIDDKEIWSIAWLTENEIRQLAKAEKMRSTSSNLYMLDQRRLSSGLSRVRRK